MRCTSVPDERHEALPDVSRGRAAIYQAVGVQLCKVRACCAARKEALPLALTYNPPSPLLLLGEGEPTGGQGGESGPVGAA